MHANADDPSTAAVGATPYVPPTLSHFTYSYHGFLRCKRIELELAELFAVPPSNLLSKLQPKTASSVENKNLQRDNAQWGSAKPGNNLENLFLIIRYFVY